MGLLFINWSKYSLVFALFYASIISFLLYSFIIVNPLLNLMGDFKQNDSAVMLFFIQGSKKIAEIIESVTKARTCRQTLEFVYMFLSCHACVSEWIHSYLNVKELLAQNRRNIWSLYDCNGTQPTITWFINEHSFI